MSQKQVENRLSNQYKKPSNKIVENSDMAFRTVDISNKTEKKKDQTWSVCMYLHSLTRDQGASETHNI